MVPLKCHEGTCIRSFPFTQEPFLDAIEGVVSLFTGVRTLAVENQRLLVAHGAIRVLKERFTPLPSRTCPYLFGSIGRLADSTNLPPTPGRVVHAFQASPVLGSAIQAN